MRYCPFPAGFVLLLIAAAPSQPLDPAALLALHARYVGWQFGDGTFTSMRITGNVVNTQPDPGATPRPPALVVRLTRGADFRETYTDAVTRRSDDNGFTGRVFWQSNDNGFTHPIIGEAEKYDIDTELLFREATATLTGSRRDPITIDGKRYPVVRVEPAAAFPIDLAVDPQTGAYVRAVVDPGGSYEATIDIVKYADVLPGKRMIAEYRIHDSHFTTEYTSFQANVPISDEGLHPPPQTATWTFANPSPFPIDVAGGAFVLVHAGIDGKGGTFLLDTGAGDVVMTSRFAALAHVRRVESSRIGGIGGTTSAESDIIDTLTVGGNTLSNVIATSSPLGDYYHGLFGGYRGETIDGIIGYDLFGGAVVKVNIGAQTMTILDPRTADLSKERGILLNVDLSSDKPIIPMTLDGTIHVNALLDSGDSVGIGYAYHFAEKHHLTLLRWNGIAGGVGGYEGMRCGGIGELQIGTVVYEGERACAIGAIRADYFIVGIDFLKHFDWVFDYPAGQLILEPIGG
ncbi:MAG: retropepsin-like aspartic protease [Candidatus Tyrphobacter sp.]